MAIVKGICKNFGECDLADNKEIQEVDKTNFVCEECGKPLHPVDGDGGGGGKTSNGGKGKTKLIAGIIAAVAVLAGAAFGVWKYKGDIFGFVQPKKVYVESISVQDSVLNMNLKDKKQIALTVSPEVHDEAIVWSSSDTLVATVSTGGEIVAKKVGKTTIAATANLSNKNAKIEVTVKDPNGPINLGYGIYTGDRRNGKPHGHGTIRYTTTHQIVSWKDYIASPGDTFEGDFRDGKITGLGYWKRKSDGNIIAIQ